MAVTARALARRYPVLAVCVAVGILAALAILWQRYALERAYHTVEITADGGDWLTLTQRDGVDRATLYGALYRHGVRSVTLYASSLRRLSDAGLLSYMNGSDVLDAVRTGSLGGPLADLARAGRIHAGSMYVLGPAPILRFVQRGFADQLSAARATLLRGSGPVLEIGARGREIEDASLGVLPADVRRLREHHLAAELRVRNFHNVAPGGLDAFFAGLRGIGQPFTLIFDRDQVLGYDSLVPEVAAQMKQAGFAFGRIEAFTAKRRQKGEDALTRLVTPDVIRVFSLAPEELAGLTPAQARDKFVLAARERNVRILYVRPFLTGPTGVDEMQANLDYVGSIADELTRAGYRLGKAVPMPVLHTSAPLFGLAALGTLAASAIAAGEVWGALVRPVPMSALYLGTGAGVVVTLGALAVHHATLWREIVALLAALAFPTLAMMWLIPGARREEGALRSLDASVRSGWRALGAGIGGLWAVSAVTALGGFMVAALLSEWAFMMEIREFLGVKIALVVPVAVIGLMIAAAGAPPGGLWRRLRGWLRQPLLLEYGIVIVVVAAAAAFALGRTGNSGLPLLGGAELKSRVILQHVLVARPRTKEYLIGNPFMVLAFALAAGGLRRWVLPAAMIGAIGQVDLVNSFSHIHTPLEYSVMRTVYALAIGSVLGAVLVGLLWWARRRWGPDARGRRAAGPAPETPQMG